MIALYIIAGIALLITIALCIRIRVYVTYDKEADDDGELIAYAKIGPVKMMIHPEEDDKIKLSDFSADKYKKLVADLGKEKKTASKDKADSEESSLEKEAAEILSGGIFNTLSLIIGILEKFSGHIRCDLVKLKFHVGTGDASTTAYSYVGLTYAADLLLGFIGKHTDLRLKVPEDVAIITDFDSESFYGNVRAKFSITVFNFIRGELGFIKEHADELLSLDSKK